MARETNAILFVAIFNIFMKELIIEGKPTSIVDCSNPKCINVPIKHVCGEKNGSMLTFENRCELELAKCKIPEITFVQEGKCKEKWRCKDVKCPTGQSCIYDQDGFSYCIETNCEQALTKKCPVEGKKVCGLNNITYESECHLEKEACNTHQVLLKRYDGSCEEKKTCADTVCRKGESCVTAKDGTPRCIECCLNKKDTNYKVSMCGSDGKTYSSWCEMRAESCRLGKLIEFVDWLCSK
ncbi:follistatin-like [Clytia hemisphaerica]|uniref:Kazal-like domain-containing protein n=1 Tax=Clytia hemisphaerica TaxID=252671 RepID=A0A7M5XAX0_9CNID